MQEIKIGDLLKDDVSGALGVAMGVCEYLGGRKSVLFTPRERDERTGLPMAGDWIDVARLNFIEE